MCGETILRDTRNRVVGDNLFIETRFHHPPAKNTLESDTKADKEELGGQRTGKLVSRKVVDGGKKETNF